MSYPGRRHQQRASAFRMLVFVLLCLAAIAWPAASGAQENPAAGDDPTGGGEGEEAPFAVFGTLNVVQDGARTGVEGVVVEVLDEAGDVLGSATSGEDGKWEVGVAEPTSYLVRIDLETLPAGVTIADPAAAERTVELSDGRVRVGALFPLESGAEGAATTGPDGDPTTPTGDSGSDGSRSDTERFLQLLVEGVRFGLLLGLMAIGLSLIFGTTGLTNFAHAEMVTFGALAAFFFNVTVGLHVIPAFLLAAVAGGLAGALFDTVIFRPLRRRGTSLVAQLVVTIGLSIFLRYLFLYLFRGDRRSYLQYSVQQGVDIGPVSATPKDLWTIGICIVILGAVGLLLQRTRTGRAMRAVSDNRDLASSSGINVERVIVQVWILGGSIAALSGALFGLSESVAWDMGFKLLLLIFAGVTLGGLGTAFGAAVGSLFIGVFVMVSTMVIPAELKNVGALVVLILVLVIRPQGIMGRSERIG